jgi:hypothetical protein
MRQRWQRLSRLAIQSALFRSPSPKFAYLWVIEFRCRRTVATRAFVVSNAAGASHHLSLHTLRELSIAGSRFDFPLLVHAWCGETAPANPLDQGPRWCARATTRPPASCSSTARRSGSRPYGRRRLRGKAEFVAPSASAAFAPASTTGTAYDIKARQRHVGSAAPSAKRRLARRLTQGLAEHLA